MDVPTFLECFKKIRAHVRAVDAPVKRIMDVREADPFKVAVGTVLSARTRDDRLIHVLRELFREVRTPQDILDLPPARLRTLLRPLGFYRMKARILRGFAQTLLEDFGGRVPQTMKELLTLPGVGIKVAAIILIEAFGKNEISVDIHVHRIMNRLGVVQTKAPEKTCAELYRLMPRRVWRHLNWNLVAFGQTQCRPVRPRCGECPIRSFCPRLGLRP
jgi:endonuclease-3